MKCWRCSKRQVFVELAVGIEFIDDESFALYHKKSSRDKIVEAIRNIQRHGLSVRGLFILGADNHTVGAEDQLADFVIKHHIKGALIQCMYFVPGLLCTEAIRTDCCARIGVDIMAMQYISQSA